MSLRLESDEGKTSSRVDVFKRSPSDRPRRKQFLVRAAIVLAVGAGLFAAGAFIGRVGRPDERSSAPVELLGFDAASIQLLDASLELGPIEGFDAGDAGVSR
jgi:hypothetical protein